LPKGVERFDLVIDAGLDAAARLELAAPLPVLTGLAAGVLPAAGDLRLFAPGMVAALVRVGAEWTVKEIAVTDGPDLPHPQPDGTPAMGSGDIPVHLSFEIETRRATIAEVQALHPGAVLSMPVSATGPGLAVRVLANGRESGAGTLIEVDGQQAVRLVTLFGQG
jgi:flagellar motor switch/type III secretory pathway protein FliN